MQWIDQEAGDTLLDVLYFGSEMTVEEILDTWPSSEKKPWKFLLRWHLESMHSRLHATPVIARRAHVIYEFIEGSQMAHTFVTYSLTPQFRAAEAQHRMGAR